MASSYRLTLERYLSSLELKGDILIDIGGSQNRLANRVKKLDVSMYVVADLDTPHKDSAKPDIVLDLNKELRHNREYIGKADIITCFEVMEYVWNPALAFKNISQLLNDSGVAYISFPTFYPLHQPIEDDALRYMPSGIQKLANYANLEMIDMVKRRPETNTLQSYFSAERLRAAKGEDHAFMGFICKFRKKVKGNE